MVNNMERIYLDHAAATPVDKGVVAAMRPYFTDKFGNPGSLHREGQIASAAVFNSRLKIARALECGYREIIFTGSATEANNLALRAVIKNVKIKMQNDSAKLKNLRPKIIISTVEHESISETAADLEKEGVEVARIPVSREGLVDLGKLKAALDERTVLVSVMYVNNEIGMIQPIKEIAKIIEDFRKEIPNSRFPIPNKFPITQFPILHIDAVQAFQYLPCRPAELNVDLMTLSAHKIYGPKGMGLLYVRRPTSDVRLLSSFITGGGQEGGMRAGTENVPYIAGFAEAVEITEAMREKEAKRIAKLRDYFWQEIRRKINTHLNPALKALSGGINPPPASRGRKEGMELNGSLKNRLPNNLNIYFPGHKAQDLLIALDVYGVAASSGSACSARTTEPSRVIMALGYNRERALSSLRFTLGRRTTKNEIDITIKVLLKCLGA